MLEGVFAATSGLKASQRRLEVTGHNLANASTPGFVPRRVDLAETAGGGVQAVGSSPLPSGPITLSASPLDLAIDGGGFFILQDLDGAPLYTRAGVFHINQEGRLTDPLGRALASDAAIPPDAAQVHVTPQGQVQALAGDGRLLASGQIATAVFGNPGGLEAVGGNAFRATAASGPPVVAAPGAAGHGRLVSGAQQASGTDAVRSMVDLILTQHHFSANLATLRTQDQLVGSILDIVA